MKRIIYTFLLPILLASCYDETKYLEQRNKTAPRIVLTPEGGRAIANGVDSLNIKVYFPLAANLKMRSTVFKASEGVFFENNKAEFSSSDAFRENQEAEVFVKANLKTTLSTRENLLVVDMPELKRTITYRIRFKESFPVAARVEKSKFSVVRGFSDEILLTAYLKADRGLPSLGTEVEFVVTDTLSSANSAQFRGLTKTDEQGKAEVYFTPGDFKGYTGSVSFKAISKDANGQKISASGSFVIRNKE